MNLFVQKRLSAAILVIFLVPALAQAAEMEGEQVYAKWCDGCHMDSPFAPGTIQLRHLRGEAMALIRERKDLSGPYIKQVVRRGMNGMPLFRRTEISENELDALVELLEYGK